LSKIGAFG